MACLVKSGQVGGVPLSEISTAVGIAAIVAHLVDGDGEATFFGEFALVLGWDGDWRGEGFGGSPGEGVAFFDGEGSDVGGGGAAVFGLAPSGAGGFDDGGGERGEVFEPVFDLGLADGGVFIAGPVVGQEAADQG